LIFGPPRAIARVRRGGKEILGISSGSVPAEARVETAGAAEAVSSPRTSKYQDPRSIEILEDSKTSADRAEETHKRCRRKIGCNTALTRARNRR